MLSPRAEPQKPIEVMNVRIAIALWGTTYTRRFLDVVLPSYLSPGNLPACVRSHDIALDIFTTTRDARAILDSSPFRALPHEAEVNVHEVVDDMLEGQGENKWHIKGRVQALAIRKAIVSRSVLLLMNPDSLVSDGTFSKTLEFMEEGYRVVNVLEFARITSETAVPDLARRFRSDDGSVLTASPRELVATAMRHLHPIGALYRLDRENVSGWPSIAYWPCGGDSMLARAFHLHPQAIDLRDCPADIPDRLMTDDGGLVEFLGFRKPEIRTVCDSDDFALCELSSLDIDPMAAVDRAVPDKARFILEWAKTACIPEHIHNYCEHTFLFRGPRFEENQDKARREFDAATVRLRIGLRGLVIRKRLRRGSVRIIRFLLRLVPAILVNVRAVGRRLCRHQ